MYWISAYNTQIMMSALNKVIDVNRIVPIMLDLMNVAAVIDMSYIVTDTLAMVHYTIINFQYSPSCFNSFV